MSNSETSLISSPQELKEKTQIIAFENYHRALQYTDRAARTREPISESLIKEIHHRCMEGLLPDTADGCYRTLNVGISGSCLTPPDWQNVPWLMKEFVGELNKRLNNCGQGIACLPIIMETLAFDQYVFERIHPFEDGNTRAGMLLRDLIAKKYRFKPIIIWPVEKKDYILTFEAVNRSGNLAHLELFLIRHLLERYRGSKGHNLETFHQLGRLAQEKERLISTQKGEREAKEIWPVLGHRAFD